MTDRFSPDAVDLAEVAAVLRESCGQTVEGEVVGRTLLRDEVVRQLGCSQLEAETLVDTLVNREFLVRRRDPDGLIAWLIEPR